MSKSTDKVAVGLSGGVDSAVAAHLLLEEGWSVTGIFMKNWDEDDGTEYCTATADYEDAQRIADRLKIDLIPINFAAEYWDLVFADFLAEYEAGRTPNPDVLCNRHIKFNMFVEYAKSLEMNLVATGHYAKGVRDNDCFHLLRPIDRSKDQTYFLQAVERSRFSNVLFPLADLKKSEVRRIARELRLHIYDKKDSTGICFIGERRFQDFLARYVAKRPGEIQTSDGTVIGEHQGLAYYTLGQRKGIGIGGLRDAREAPWYVVAKRFEENVLLVSQDENDLLSRELEADTINWLVDEPLAFRTLGGMTRYRQEPQSCEIALDNGTMEVTFQQPQRAVTPGQYIALYQDDLCLGGAKINHVRDAKVV